MTMHNENSRSSNDTQQNFNTSSKDTLTLILEHNSIYYKQTKKNTVIMNYRDGSSTITFSTTLAAFVAAENTKHMYRPDSY